MVCVATDSPVLEKVLSNVAEVRARGADVIAVATEGVGPRSPRSPTRPCSCRAPTGSCSRSSRSLPLQLLAYHIARLNGLNVDQPRNLAKTVTVE